MKKLVALATFALCSSAMVAGASTAPSFAGTYQYVGGNAEKDALSSAVETVVHRMNFFFRGIARGRLKKSNQPSAELTLAIDRGAITVVRTGQQTVSAPANGQPIKVRLDGDDFQVAHGFDGARLYQTFLGPKSFSRNDLALSPDGNTLTVFTHIESRYFPIPLDFHMTYRKVTSGP